MAHYYVYITTNTINGRMYIGKRKCHCEVADDSYLGSGKALKLAINKYGSQNFEKRVIEECQSEEECNIRERFWIQKFDAVNDDRFYNIALGGDGGNTYAGLSEDERDRLSIVLSKRSSGENNPRYGVTATDETRRKISQALKELYSNPENTSRYGKFGPDNPCSKRIKCVELDRVFVGIREAARQMQIPSPNITKALKDPTRFSAGKHNGQKLHWIYLEDEKGTQVEEDNIA